MRATPLTRAVAALALAGALTISPVLTNYAAAQRPVSDIGHEEWRTLSEACTNEKAAALAVLFPNGATAQQQEDLDQAFAQQLTGASSAQLMPQWQAFSDQSVAGAPHAAENAFAACVYHARIRQLDPNAVFATPAQSQTDQLFANLPRRDSGAGASMIAESLDPAARAERQRLQQQADAERQARQQQAAANNAAFWDTLLGVVATVGSAYVNYESQRAQIEAGNQAAAAQAAANAAAMQQQQPGAPSASDALHVVGGYTCSDLPGSGNACGGGAGGGAGDCITISNYEWHNHCNRAVEVLFTFLPVNSGTPENMFPHFRVRVVDDATIQQTRTEYLQALDPDVPVKNFRILLVCATSVVGLVNAAGQAGVAGAHCA
jgi:hypothetical protein